jgi:hypothetical protein
MPVLDAVARDNRVTEVTLVEPDIYQPHNVHRHLFGHSAVGRRKVELANEWLADRRPELKVRALPWDLTDLARQAELDALAATADVGVCAADNEPAKYHFDALMRRHGKPWTLGEVLSGGIAGWVHWFRAGGPCYGCVASHLQRSAPPQEQAGPAPDYSAPGGPVHETTIPASKASIQTVSGLHALVTLGLLEDPTRYDPGFTSLLLTLRRVPEVFEEAFRPFRFRIARAAGCLICHAGAAPAVPEDLDVALDQALARLGDD